MASCAPTYVREKRDQTHCCRGEEGRERGSGFNLILSNGPLQQPRVGYWLGQCPESQKGGSHPLRADGLAVGALPMLLAVATIRRILGTRGESRVSPGWSPQVVSASRPPGVRALNSWESGKGPASGGSQVQDAAPPPTGCVTLAGVCLPAAVWK